MNENDPSNLARLTSYLGREQYGEAPLFLPRRWDTMDPTKQGMFTNYSSDMDYMMRYQLGHMFARYLLQNYAGGEGDWQDARANLYPLNGALNTIFKVFSNVQPFAGSARDSLFCIPLLLGLFGVYYQFKKDWKMGLVFLSMFIILGPLLALYQNQQEPQPRERDYFYVGAFYVFSLWIAVGIAGMVDLLRRQIQSEAAQRAFAVAIVVLFALAIPVNMARSNWETHNRSGNYVAWDFSYNMLQSCEKDAILFTNGDNDTFPLWYLQDVEGVRRDVRIVNLSLANTPWYIKQLKAPPYYREAKAVPISLSDSQIDRLQLTIWEPQKMAVPVSREVFAHYGVMDTAEINRGKIEFLVSNTMQFGETKAIRIQDRMVLDIILTNQWSMPIYFASSGAADSRLGLDDHLWLRGLAYRLEPRRVGAAGRGVDPEALEANLFQEPKEFSHTPQPGFKFRGTANPNVYFDENTNRMLSSYRWGFLQLAQYYEAAGKNAEKAVAVLDRMEEVLPRSKVALGWDLTTYVASLYNRVGRTDRFNELAAEIEPVARKMIESGEVNMNAYDNPYSVLLEIYDAKRDYSSMLALLKDLAGKFPNDAGIKRKIEEVQSLVQRQQSDTTPPSR